MYKKTHPLGVCFSAHEVSAGFEPAMELLQSSALPLGYDTSWFAVRRTE